MNNEFISEHLYLFSSKEVNTKKLLLADFNFSEVSINFSIHLESKEIKELIQMNCEYDSKEITTNAYNDSFEQIYHRKISEEDLCLHKDMFKTLSPAEFKNILIENNLFNKFLKEVYIQKAEELTYHIHTIFEV